MASYTKILCSIAIVLCLANAVFAIHCNECESNQYAKCKDPFGHDVYFELDCDQRGPPKFLQDLNPGITLRATGCMKKTFKFDGNSNVIQRACYWGEKNTTTGCHDDPLKPFLQQLSCNICDTEMCNSSTVTGPLAFGIVLFYVFTRLLS